MESCTLLFGTPYRNFNMKTSDRNHCSKPFFCLKSYEASHCVKASVQLSLRSDFPVSLISILYYKGIKSVWFELIILSLRSWCYCQEIWRCFVGNLYKTPGNSTITFNVSIYSHFCCIIVGVQKIHKFELWRKRQSIFTVYFRSFLTSNLMFSLLKSVSWGCKTKMFTKITEKKKYSFWTQIYPELLHQMAVLVIEICQICCCLDEVSSSRTFL